MKSLKRVLGCVGALTLMVAACSDDDTSLGGTGGSSAIGGSGGIGCSAGSAGLGGSSGSAGTAGTAGVGGSGGSAGSAGSAGQGGSAGDGDAGVIDSGVDPDGGGDSGTAARTLTEVCTDYCAGRAAFAAQPVDAGGGAACGDQSDVGACTDSCVGQSLPYCATQYQAMIDCFFTANDWVCGGGSMDAGPTCGATAGEFGICASNPP